MFSMGVFKPCSCMFIVLQIVISYVTNKILTSYLVLSLSIQFNFFPPFNQFFPHFVYLFTISFYKKDFIFTCSTLSFFINDDLALPVCQRSFAKMIALQSVHFRLNRISSFFMFKQQNIFYVLKFSIYIYKYVYIYDHP